MILVHTQWLASPAARRETVEGPSSRALRDRCSFHKQVCGHCHEGVPCVNHKCAECDESYHDPRMKDYRGCQTVTMCGKPCQSWSVQHPSAAGVSCSAVRSCKNHRNRPTTSIISEIRRNGNGII